MTRRMLAMVALLLVTSGQARAQTCSFSIANPDFGDVNVAFNSYVYSVVRLKANCTGNPNGVIRFCANLGAGTGGMDASGLPRYLASGSNTLAFDIFPFDITNTWGSDFDSAPTTAIERFVQLDSTGKGRAVYPIRLRIRYGQQSTPAGTYTTSFAGSDSRINYGTYGSCAALYSGNVNPVELPFTASARVSATCALVDLPDVNFGTQPAIISQPIDSSATFRVYCPNNVPYTIALDGGGIDATDPTKRQMSVANTVATGVTYGLYSDAAYTMPWGSTPGVNTVSGTGTQALQTYRIYARIPPQTATRSGYHQDGVAITLTY